MNTENLKTHTIAECLGFPEGTPIPRVMGTVKQIWDIKRGEKDGKAWSIQSGILQNGNDTMKFTLSGCPNFPFTQGQKVIFRSNKGSRGLTGVKIKIDTYKDKNEPMIWLTPTAIILNEDEESDDIPMDYNTLSKPEMTISHEVRDVAVKNPPKANVEPKKATSEGGVSAVKHRLMQMANFRALCDASVEYLYGEGASDEMKKDVSSCFFIQGMREGLEKHLPATKPLSKKEDVEASEPEMEPEDIKF